MLAGLLDRYRERVATLRDPADRAAERRWLTATRARRMLAAGAFGLRGGLPLPRGDAAVLLRLQPAPTPSRS